MKYKIITILFLLPTFIFPVYSNYSKNITDEYKIYLYETKVSKILKKSNNPKKISQKYRNIIKEKLSEKKKDIKHYNNLQDIENFQEYALLRLYYALYYSSYLGDISIQEHHFKILENKYIKTFAKESNLYIDDTSVYGMYRENTKKVDYISFYPVEKNIDSNEYIVENFYDEKYKGICELEELKHSNMNFFETPTYHFEEQIQDTAEGPFFKRLCGELNKGVFTRISDTVIIYIPRQYEYVGLDFRVIEIKK